MTTVWKPSPRELRQWALLTGPALGVAGALFYFVDWGVFAAGRGLAKFFWGFGAFAFLTAITGTRLGWPAYWFWTAVVRVISEVITHLVLAAVFFGVVTPLALAARLAGRDRLQLRNAGHAAGWQAIDPEHRHDPLRTF